MVDVLFPEGTAISLPARVPVALSIPNRMDALVFPDTALSSGIVICCHERLPPAYI